MEKFTVGDRVRVREDLLINTFYDDGCKFISDMEDTLGKVGEVVRISENEERIRYIIKLDSDDYYNPYCFSKSMLEPMTNNNKMEIYRIDDDCPYMGLVWHNIEYGSLPHRTGKAGIIEDCLSVWRVNAKSVKPKK